jgi:hypothetical protein
MSGEAAAHPVADGAIVSVDIGDQIASDETLPVADGRRARIHAAEISRFRVRHHDDHSREPGREGAIRGRGTVEMGLTPEPAEIRVGEPVQEINDRITGNALRFIAGRQINRNIAVGRVTLEVPFQ